MKNWFFLMLLTLTVGVFFTACNRDKSDYANEASTTEDVNDAEAIMVNVEMEADEDMQALMTTECPIVTWTAPQGTFPNTVTIDYGTDGCEGPNGHMRKGMITINMSDSMIHAGAVREISFQDFSIDDIQIEGVRTVTNTGLNGAGQPTFSRTVVDASLTWPDATTVSWQSNTTGTMIEGFGDNVLLNNVWSISGTSSGLSKNGAQWASEITQPIIRKHACPWPVSGFRTITVGGNTASLDYSYGTGIDGCDRKGLLTLPNGNTRVVSVRF
jgi:hypothetical protein